MERTTDDLRVETLRPLVPPMILVNEELPITDQATATVTKARHQIDNILNGQDGRLLVIAGPCSIHDTDAALEYAGRLKREADRLADDLYIIMRVYFEKPRTTVGWKGLINDPNLDGKFNINKGLRVARGLLLELANMGVPAGSEFLDTISPQFTADLVSWGAIGARTAESQVHRELASGLSMPVGFKNGTGGSIQIAIDGVRAACHPHHFLGVTDQGIAAIISTSGNASCHVILRGSNAGPNYDRGVIDKTAETLRAADLPNRVLVDCSHGNSQKDYRRQPEVCADVCAQVAAGSDNICGVMMESHLVAGRQDIKPDTPLTYGQSVTDACIDWETTVPMLEDLARAAAARRA
ncbi:MAG: 3-deoxy-7-phosphoheptulonate synthase [Deltaproteobacteria bacterium]|nr:3-deoxy-7-phosphoheptulonate synthase [Deltaproteobacteria bacterium]